MLSSTPSDQSNIKSSSISWYTLHAEQIRVLYLNSKIPTLLMLLCTIPTVWIVSDTHYSALLIAWVLAVLAMTAMRFVSARLFERASEARRILPIWQTMLLACACFSGSLIALVAVYFVPGEEVMQQLLLLGLLSIVIISASIAYAVSLLLYSCYAVCVFLPMLWVYFNTDADFMQGLGFLILMYALGMTAAVYQVNRLLRKVFQQRTENQLLIATLQTTQQRTDRLNAELILQVADKHSAEQELLAVQASLEHGVNARTLELKEALQELEASQERLELALDASQLALWDWHLDTDEVHHTLIKSIFGLEDGQVRGVLRDLRPLLHPEDLPVLRNAMIEHMKQRTDGYVVEYRIKHSDGHWVWIEDRGRAVQRNADGRVVRMLGTRRDISQRKQHDEQLRLASSVFDAGTESIVILDANYIILAVNKAFTSVTGFEREEVVGRHAMFDHLPEEVLERYRMIIAAVNKDGSWQGETIDVRKSGEIYPQTLQIHAIRNLEGEIIRIVCFVTDLTARRKAEERLTYLTQYDELTGLANRALFHRRLQQAVEHAREKEGRMALLHIDLDRFKVLNDSLSVEIADQVLRTLSRRLTQLLPVAGTIARLGGDEFAIILDDYRSAARVSEVASSVLAQIRAPIEVAGNELVISASVGISVLPDNAREPAALISQANMAMQHAKHLGGDNLQFYNNQLQAATLERLQLEQQLRRGIDEGQLQAYYQPKLTLADGCIRSAEALVRWNHPTRGLVPPGEFIALAEETGLICAISEMMLYQACEQSVRWLKQGRSIRVSVNLSVTHVRQGNLVELVQNVLAKTGLPAYLLELELTETQMLDNAASIIETFKQLRALGVHLAIDDFGTGYSSLSYLKRFPANSVKIDQSFIRDVTENDEDAAITRAIITMAHGLNLLVVAEGVETQEQLDFLKANHCDEVQGYFICRPIPAEHFAEFLNEHACEHCQFPH